MTDREMPTGKGKPSWGRTSRFVGHSWLGTYQYWHPFIFDPTHRRRYRFWHVLWWAAVRRNPLMHWRVRRALTGPLTARRNAAFTGMTLGEHADDWREGRW